MRKLLAGFLATAMVASLGATMTFAAAAKATFTIDANALLLEGSVAAATVASPNDNIDQSLVTGSDAATLGVGDAEITVYTDTGIPFVFTNTSALSAKTATALTKADILPAFVGAQASNAVDGTNFTMEIKSFTLASGKWNVEINPAGKINFQLQNAVRVSPDSGNPQDNDNGIWEFEGTRPTTSDFTTGSGGVNNITDGDDMYYTQALVCDTAGTPIALVESKDDRNGADGVRSDATVYFALNEPYSNPDLFKVKANKGKNAKNVKAITVVEKRFSDPLVKLSDGGTLAGTAGVRRSYVKVELAELFTDDEYKITYDLKISTESKGEKLYPNFADVTLKEDDIATVWLKNKVTTADGEFRVGTGGLMLNPLQNDWNEVTYYDEDSDLAFLKFFADSDVDKFYAKLSTKWEHADYASYFNDQDAYIFDFVGSPKISATSRCDLQIYNPFVNEDGDETIDPSSATIYQVIDGDLFDVTDSFKYEEGDNGEMAYTTRTRFLGTYIICEKPVEEAVDNTEEVPADLVPEDTTPSEVTPDNNSGGKAPANTGKYL